MYLMRETDHGFVKIIDDKSIRDHYLWIGSKIVDTKRVTLLLNIYAMCPDIPILRFLYEIHTQFRKKEKCFSRSI